MFFIGNQNLKLFKQKVLLSREYFFFFHNVNEHCNVSHNTHPQHFHKRLCKLEHYKIVLNLLLKADNTYDVKVLQTLYEQHERHLSHTDTQVVLDRYFVYYQKLTRFYNTYFFFIITTFIGDVKLTVNLFTNLTFDLVYNDLLIKDGTFFILN